MTREQSRKLKKRTQRKKEIADQKRRAEAGERQRRKELREFLRRDQYPRIFLDTTEGEPEFVELVRRALAEFDFDNEACCPPHWRDAYRLIRTYGWRRAESLIEESWEQYRDEKSPPVEMLMIAFVCHLGHELMARIPEGDRVRLMPYNDVQVVFGGRTIVLRFSSMLSESGPAGRLYYSRRRPTVTFDGQPWTVAFSRHAIERICERLNPGYLDYAAAGDIHSYFSNCVYFEPVELYGGQPAICLFQPCESPEFMQHYIYVSQILGEANVDPQGCCYYRVGYCPVVFERGFAKATTFLYPGFAKTPEYGLIMQAKLPKSERDLLIERSTNNDAMKTFSVDYSIIKWFHDNGIPQVVQWTRTVFASREVSTASTPRRSMLIVAPPSRSDEKHFKRPFTIPIRIDTCIGLIPDPR